MSAIWQRQLGDLPGYQYDRRLGRYRDVKTGRFVARAKIVGLVQQRIDHHQEQLVAITRSYLQGGVSLQDWQRLMKDQLKMLHIQQAVLARGGFANMTPSDWGRVGLQVRKQYAYLAGFAEDLANGTFKSGREMTGPMSEVRAGLYAQSGRETFWRESTAIAKKEQGKKEEKRIAIGDDGTCSPCTDLAAKEWQPIGTLPPPGGDPCEGLTRCRCEMEYR